MPLPANLTHPPQVAPLLARAAELLKDGRPADAIAPLREAALLQPSDPIIQHDLGLACLEIGRVPEAIAAFQRAVSSNPRYADAYFRMGIALEKLGDRGSADRGLRPCDRTAAVADRGVVPRRRLGPHDGPS